MLIHSNSPFRGDIFGSVASERLSLSFGSFGGDGGGCLLPLRTVMGKTLARVAVQRLKGRTCRTSAPSSCIDPEQRLRQRGITLRGRQLSSSILLGWGQVVDNLEERNATRWSPAQRVQFKHPMPSLPRPSAFSCTLQPRHSFRGTRHGTCGCVDDRSLNSLYEG